MGLLHRVPSDQSSCSQSSTASNLFFQDDDRDYFNDIDDSDVFHDVFETPTPSISTEVEEKSSVFSDIAKAELALWTFAFSLLFTKLWIKRRKYLLINIVVVTPTAIWITAVLSGLLIIFTVFERLFGSEKLDSNNWISRSATPELQSRKSSLESVHGLRSCGSYGEELALLTCRRHLSFFGNRPPLSRKLSMQTIRK